MQRASHIQANIEILQHLLDAWHKNIHQPADKLLQRYFRERRYIGSKDRGAISELFYWCIRNLSSIKWWQKKAGLPHTARSLLMVACHLHPEWKLIDIFTLFSGKRYAPEIFITAEKRTLEILKDTYLDHPDMPEHIRLNIPEWTLNLFKENMGKQYLQEVQALNQQAPVDIRANTLLTSRETLQQQLVLETIETTPTPTAPNGLRLTKRAPIFTSKLFTDGHFEMQDEGSQIIAELVEAKPGMKIIDFCAGAGGKTLSIAASMNNKGRILAWDISPARINELNRRLRRAKVDNVTSRVINSEQDSHIKRHKASADRVLVDVPCSGTGTWRRNPDLKWHMSPNDITEISAQQRAILASAARLPKPGGWLIYATCSLLKQENEDIINDFMRQQNEYTLLSAEEIWQQKNESAFSENAPHTKNRDSFLWLTPYIDNTDGFFAAILQRNPIYKTV